MRAVFRLAAVGGVAALLSGAPAHAAGVCLMGSNGAPQFVQGTGKANQQNDARNKAMSNWSSKSMSFGGAYQNWGASTGKNLTCSSTKVGFSRVYTCVAIAQPCK